jgi:hypothetical protein
MADWQTVKASEVVAGQRVRGADGAEITATRIEWPFLGWDGMVAFIEDTPERWYKRPFPVEAEVEVRTGD